MKFIFSLLTVLLFALCAFGQTEQDKGVELYLQGDYNGAVEVLQKFLETDENNRDGWLYLGMSLAKLKKNKEAFKALRTGDSISSKDSSYYDKELKFISKPRPSYTELARQELTAGRVKLAVEFGADGTIKAIIPFQTLPNGLTESCLAVVKNIKFEPAVKNGKAVTAIKVVEYSFDIY